MRQLTWRAVLMGASLLGAVLSLTNLYIGLKAGWGFGVAITACILSYAIIGGLVGVVLTLLARIFPRHQHLIPSPAGVDVSLVLWRAVLPRRGAGLVGGAEVPGVVGGVHLPRRVGWIAGESLMGVALVAGEHRPDLVRQLLRR